MEVIGKLTERIDILYLSIDIDVVNEKFAPGVIAPSKSGINNDTFLRFIKTIITNPKIGAVDIVEISNRETPWHKLLGKKYKKESWKERKHKMYLAAEIGAEIIKNIILKN